MLETSPAMDMCPNEKTYESFQTRGYHNLRVESTLEEVEQLHKTHNCLVVRPWKGEKLLIVGCGNEPADSTRGGGDDDECRRYLLAHHQHPEAYTISPDAFNYNPSTIGYYGTHEFPHLPDEAFEEICFEGVYFTIDDPHSHPKHLLALIPETLRLLRGNGVGKVTTRNNTGDPEHEEYRVVFVKQTPEILRRCLEPRTDNNKEHKDSVVCIYRDHSHYREFLWCMWGDAALGGVICRPRRTRSLPVRGTGSEIMTHKVYLL